MDWLPTAYWILSGAALIGGALLGLQSFEHRRYARGRGRRISAKAPRDHVTLFVPCKGVDDDLEQNLRAMFEQDHADYELVFIVESVDDDAYRPICRLIAEYTERRAQVLIAGLATTDGQKVHNLLAATERLPPQTRILAFADADIRPPKDWLRLLTQQLHKLGAATGYRRFVPKRTTLANLLVASIDSAVVPIMFPSFHHKVWGGSWAIRRELFESTAMRESWRGTLSDDLVASNVLAQAHQTLALETACILPSPIDIDFPTMLSWIRRQFIIGRFYSPWLWLVVLVGHCAGQLILWANIVAAAVGLAIGAAWTWQPAAVVATLYAMHVIRGWFRQSASRYYLPEHQQALAGVRQFDIWCGPLGGAVLACALVWSAIGRRISWKNNVYEMSYGGQIRRIPTGPRQDEKPKAGTDTDVTRRAA